MPRIFWTAKRKAVLLEQSRSMTLKQMARMHLQPVAEIERMLIQLNPKSPLIIRTYRWRGHKVTVYAAAYAFGVARQHVGENHTIY